MSQAKTFRTKTGFCHVLPDKIILSRDATYNESAPVTSANAMPMILGIYSLVLAYFGYRGYVSYTMQQTNAVIWYTIGFMLFAFVIIRSLNNSTTGVIERNSIREVKFKKAVPGLSRSYFMIFFTDAKGKTKRRLVMLPGSLSGGKSGTEEALQVMKGEGLLS